MSTAYHARYFAHGLTRLAPSGSNEKLSMSLFDAAVDLNPHQIEAAMFALHSPIAKGALLADEVGLGKTIEAGIVLCQLWAERKRRLLVICPASIRKQWSLELGEKFNLPSIILDARIYRLVQNKGNPRPFDTNSIIIVSMNLANALREEIRSIPWDLVVVDEAHKLRNAYRSSNKIGKGVRWAIEERRKLLLTATPLQNSLLELFGLSTIIDENLFGDLGAFRSQYVTADSNLSDLRNRLSGFCKRTLRKQVVEYVQYTARRAITRPFKPTDDEHKLYEAVSQFLFREDTYAIPHRQRHLIVLIFHKLLASSSHAIAATLDTMKARLVAIRDAVSIDTDQLPECLVEAEELEDELLDEILAEQSPDPGELKEPPVTHDRNKLKGEIDELDRLSAWSRSIGTDTKSETLLFALETGFAELVKVGAKRKALLFTESRRTQDYLKVFLEANGYRGQVVLFNGANAGPEVTQIYEFWVKKNASTGRATGSRDIDVRTALIEHFHDHATIMIGTEAAAEGINLQFCSLVINYDLPWNPQRIEQRIGRCHRYGQIHDVVVINFLNERNEADRRVYELLREKFSLFDGVFGASDEVLGSIESGVDFEKRILAICQQCRTAEEIDAAFQQLRAELDEQIRTRMDSTRQLLFEHFDADVHQRLRLQLENARQQLDEFGKRFWTVTRFVLDGQARFDDEELAFELNQPPRVDIRQGKYFLISKNQPKRDEGDETTNPLGYFLYRLSHPLGEHVIDTAKALPTPPAHVRFDLLKHPARMAMVEELRGKTGYLTLVHLTIDSFEREEHLLFSAIDDSGTSVDHETCEKLFHCSAAVEAAINIPVEIETRLQAESKRHTDAAVSRSLQENNTHFIRAREQLEKWADDMVLGAEKALKDTKEQIKALRREARTAATLAEQHDIQERMRKLERQQRKQRQEIFEAEDQIMEKRDKLIENLERRMAQKTAVNRLFTIRWSVV
ncbi:MAG: SNF2-related protein [Planctomycetota bacterium]